jgi:hypothetical protein
MSILQWRPLYLAIALLFFTCGQVIAQATAADQNFKTIPQQIKANAENKANTKANNLANSATDKLDSGMNKAFKGIGKMFKKKPKPGKDSLSTSGVPVAPIVPVTPVVPKTDTVVPKTSFLLIREYVVPAWARECEIERLKQVA